MFHSPPANGQDQYSIVNKNSTVSEDAPPKTESFAQCPFVADACEAIHRRPQASTKRKLQK
jgi:hypothetical protein